jgi:GNAT superfamily N-acetyltransferase
LAVQIALTDSDIDACYPVMSELRPHLERQAFVGIVRDMQQDGYSLAYLETGAGIVSVAGFRIMRTLFCDRALYVDDLVTASAERSKGYGKALLEWLKDRARAEGCAELHLDSAMHRKDAHRFYTENGMQTTGFHFHVELDKRVPWKS